MSRFTDFISGKPPKPVEVVAEEPIQEVVVEEEPTVEEVVEEVALEEEPAQQTYKTTTKKRKRISKN